MNITLKPQIPNPYTFWIMGKTVAVLQRCLSKWVNARLSVSARASSEADACVRWRFVEIRVCELVWFQIYTAYTPPPPPKKKRGGGRSVVVLLAHILVFNIICLEFVRLQGTFWLCHIPQYFGFAMHINVMQHSRAPQDYSISLPHHTREKEAGKRDLHRERMVELLSDGDTIDEARRFIPQHLSRRGRRSGWIAM